MDQACVREVSAMVMRTGWTVFMIGAILMSLVECEVMQ